MQKWMKLSHLWFLLIALGARKISLLLKRLKKAITAKNAEQKAIMNGDKSATESSDGKETNGKAIS